MYTEADSVVDCIQMHSVELRCGDEEGANGAANRKTCDFAASPPKRHAAINIRPYPDNQHANIRYNHTKACHKVRRL